MEVIIQIDAQPLYIINPGYFPITESANLSATECQVERPAFAGLANQGDQGSQMEQEPYYGYG